MSLQGRNLGPEEIMPEVPAMCQLGYVWTRRRCSNKAGATRVFWDSCFRRPPVGSAYGSRALTTFPRGYCAFDHTCIDVYDYLGRERVACVPDETVYPGSLAVRTPIPPADDDFFQCAELDIQQLVRQQFPHDADMGTLSGDLTLRQAIDVALPHASVFARLWTVDDETRKRKAVALADRRLAVRLRQGTEGGSSSSGTDGSSAGEQVGGNGGVAGATNGHGSDEPRTTDVHDRQDPGASLLCTATSDEPVCVPQRNVDLSFAQQVELDLLLSYDPALQELLDLCFFNSGPGETSKRE